MPVICIFTHDVHPDDHVETLALLHVSLYNIPEINESLSYIFTPRFAYGILLYGS